MTFSLKGTRLDLTDDIRRLVDDKLADALRPLGTTDLNAVNVAVELEHTTRRYRERSDARDYRAEATVVVHGTPFRAEGSADSVDAAVVAMAHQLTRQLRDWRARLRDAQRGRARDAAMRG